jgi:hypothetical protein
MYDHQVCLFVLTTTSFLLLPPGCFLPLMSHILLLSSTQRTTGHAPGTTQLRPASTCAGMASRTAPAAAGRRELTRDAASTEDKTSASK